MYELKRMHASTSGSHFYHHGSAENFMKPLHAVRARELKVPRDRMRDACQVDFENNNAVGPQDESGPCAKAMARTPLHGLVVGAFREFSPNVYTLCKELVDIGLKNPNSRISKYATPMEVDLMRGLAPPVEVQQDCCFRGQVLGGLVPHARGEVRPAPSPPSCSRTWPRWRCRR